MGVVLPAEMITRAETDNKIYIVKRLNEIQNRCNKLTPSQKLPYLKLLFTKFYQGIPKADDELVLARVEREWKLALDSRSQGKNTNNQKSQDDQAEIQRLRAELKAEKARKAGAKGETSEGQTCFLCKGSDHQIKNCPFACPTCSTDTKHKHKDRCGCTAEE